MALASLCACACSFQGSGDTHFFTQTSLALATYGRATVLSLGRRLFSRASADTLLLTYAFAMLLTLTFI